MSEEREKQTSIDKTALLVSGGKGSKEADKEYVKKLSGATLSCFAKHKISRLRCVGTSSINNGVKALTIAKMKYEEDEDSIMVFNPVFIKVNFGQEEMSGMALEVEAIEELDVPGNVDTEAALLKVKGSRGSKEANKEYVKKLSVAILSCYSKHKIVYLRFVGAPSCKNAIKAAGAAFLRASKNELNLRLVSSFTEVDFGDNKRTGIVLQVVSI